MKNTICKKLVIDRSKATKVGTLKDISLFGNFTFPTEGEFVNGLQLRPLAGVGNIVSKTMAQISQLTGRRSPIAGATGASTSGDQPAAEPVECTTPFPALRNEGYAIRFIHHAPEHAAVSSLRPIVADQYLSQRLQTGYALKHGPGKRTLFTQAQKDIMIEFYNRQAVNRIRAEPRDVIKAMQDAGLEVLTATQIRSWWSTYHRKNRDEIASSLPAANVVSSRTPPAPVPVSTSSAAVQSRVPPAPVPSSAPPATVPSSAPPATVPFNAAPATMPLSTPPATLQFTAPPANMPSSAQSAMMPSSTALPTSMASSAPPATVQSNLLSGVALSSTTCLSTVVPAAMPQVAVMGHTSQLSGAVIEWLFPENFSQSTIQGRNGSNACAFISLYFGQVASKGLPLRRGLALDVQWKDTLMEAMTRGNDLHDELFDYEGINLTVDEAVEMAGEDCGVLCLGQQKDLFGGTAVAKQLLAEFLNELSGRGQRSCFLFFSCGRTMLLFIDSSGHLYFVDSHSHRDCGALIASAPPGYGEAFADWIDRMMILNWQTPLTVGSLSEVIYA